MQRAARVLLSAAALAAALGWAAADVSAQSPEECPRVEPARPADAPFASPTMLHVVGLTDGERDRLRYHWTTSAGVIADGQGTSSVTLDLRNALTVSTEVTVVVVGLKGNCAATLNYLVLPAIACIRPLDEYGNIRFEDEQARLDNFAIELQNDPTAQGHIIAYGGRRGRAGEAQRRADRARDYLSGRRGIEASRLHTIDGGYREDLTVVLWMVPAGVRSPEPNPTVDTHEVEIITEAPEPKHRPADPSGGTER